MALVLDSQKKEQMEWALRFLREDRPVAVPTETVYGLAGRIFSDLALSRIFLLKARPHFDPLIVHVSSIEMAREMARELGDVEIALMKHFWPGPLTILVPKSSRVSDLCTAGSDLVALRSPSHPTMAALLRELGEPLAAPSANRFQGVSPTSYKDVLDELGPYGLEAVFDGGDCELGIESTVVHYQKATNILEVLRPGACAAESLEAFTREHKINLGYAPSYLDERQAQSAPGQLAKHYSPKKKVVFVSRAWIDDPTEFEQYQTREGDLHLFVTDADYQRAVGLGFLDRQHKVLGKNAEEAAAHLFKCLRGFDANESFVRLIAFEPSAESLGAAIADRLRRASGI